MLKMLQLVRVIGMHSFRQQLLPSILNNRSHLYSTTASMTHLDSCNDPAELAQIHAWMTKTGDFSTPFHWNCLIRSHLRCEFPRDAVHLYIHMTHAGFSPDSYTLPIVLKAACHLHVPKLYRQLHSSAIKFGFGHNVFCQSGLISVYSKMGEFYDAIRVFDESDEKKLGSWNAIINGLAQGGQSEEAIGFFVELRRYGLIPDDVTMVSVLSASGSLGDMNLAQQVHKCVLQADGRGLQDPLLMNALVDMYGKCGCTDLAYKVFSRMPERNVSAWTAMIMNLAMHERVSDALEYFHQMRIEGVRPNHVTFVSVLSACAHGGLVDRAIDYFSMMVNEYGIKPTIPHYGCMVDVFGRAGRLKEAKEMVEHMPMEPNSVILGTLLGACEINGNIDVGKWVASKLIQLEPWNDGVYVVLSNIYADAGMWEEVENIRILMKDMKVSKTPAYSLPIPFSAK